MTEADAEDRHARTEAANDVHRDAGVLRAARSGRDEDLLRRHGLDLTDRDLVVASDAELRAQLAQVLDQVVGERVVVVDDENHSPACAISRARITARALSRV